MKRGLGDQEDAVRRIMLLRGRKLGGGKSGGKEQAANECVHGPIIAPRIDTDQSFPHPSG